MTVRLSKMYGMDIFSGEAGYMGKVNDLILNMESGEIVRLTTVPLRNIMQSNAKEVLQKNSVLFKRVKSVKDIVLIGNM